VLVQQAGELVDERDVADGGCRLRRHALSRNVSLGA
jgi:hypothetical protein